MNPYWALFFQPDYSMEYLNILVLKEDFKNAREQKKLKMKILFVTKKTNKDLNFLNAFQSVS